MTKVFKYKVIFFLAICFLLIGYIISVSVSISDALEKGNNDELLLTATTMPNESKFIPLINDSPIKGQKPFPSKVSSEVISIEVAQVAATYEVEEAEPTTDNIYQTQYGDSAYSQAYTERAIDESNKTDK
jgi:hypothetical protein